MGFKEACASWLDPWPWLSLDDTWTDSNALRWVEIPRRVSLQLLALFLSGRCLGLRSKRLGCLYLLFLVATLSYVMVDFVSTEAGIGLSLKENTEGVARQAGHHRWLCHCMARGASSFEHGAWAALHASRGVT